MSRINRPDIGSYTSVMLEKAKPGSWGGLDGCQPAPFQLQVSDTQYDVEHLAPTARTVSVTGSNATTATGLAGPSVNLHGRTTLPQLAAVLAEADATLANDTGPLHLAAALGRPVVAPYTCTSAKLNGPYGAARGAVETTVWCQGSYVRRCARLECMAELTPDRLWPRLYEVLLTWEMRRRSA